MNGQGNIHSLYGITTWGREEKNRELLDPTPAISELSIPWNSKTKAHTDKTNHNLDRDIENLILNTKAQFFSLKNFLPCIAYNYIFIIVIQR